MGMEHMMILGEVILQEVYFLNVTDYFVILTDEGSELTRKKVSPLCLFAYRATTAEIQEKRTKRF